MGVYERQLRLVAPYQRRIVLAMLCMALVAACATASLYLIKPAFDDLIVNKNKEMLNLICRPCSSFSASKARFVRQRLSYELRQPEDYNQAQGETFTIIYSACPFPIWTRCKPET